MSLDTFAQRAAADHAAEVARGEHDDQCEFRPGGFYICHCSKRARIAQGYTTPPGELIWNPPDCPRCWREVEFDGDLWTCRHCRCHWDSYGYDAEFDDDHGDDLAADLAAWEAAHGAKGATHA